MKNHRITARVLIVLIATMTFMGGAGPPVGSRPTGWTEKCTVTDPISGIMWSARPDQIGYIETIFGEIVVHITYQESKFPWEYDVSVVSGIVDCERCLCWPMKSP